ncbi:hypothetical protein [Kribbella sp. NPDC000426]|uniref:hypothetical protein n=1 Tax=Kribbella sp. NPDC000426 TaxID=3154255 RepID=UPI003331C6DD
MHHIVIDGEAGINGNIQMIGVNTAGDLFRTSTDGLATGSTPNPASAWTRHDGEVAPHAS